MHDNRRPIATNRPIAASGNGWHGQAGQAGSWPLSGRRVPAKPMTWHENVACPCGTYGVATGCLAPHMRQKASPASAFLPHRLQ